MTETGTIANPPQQIRGYLLLDKLGSGGMAEVFLAMRSGPAAFEKLCVIKRILPHLAEDSHFITMFLDEARIAAGLNHPNIVQVYDLGFDGHYYMAMEYIEGISLARMVLETRRRRQRLDPYLVASLGVQALDGLHYAHEEAHQNGAPLHIVHRDINPRNLMINYSGLVKIVDFGIAKARGRLTRTAGRPKGTPSYMSPEQIAGQSVDARTDIYSLGVVLYEMLTARRLFKRNNEAATLNAVLKESVPPLEKYRPDITDRQLEAVIIKMLAREREDRYAGAREAREALLEVLDRAGVRSRPPELAEYLRQFPADRRPKLQSRAADTKPDIPMTDTGESGESNGSGPPPTIVRAPSFVQAPAPSKWPWVVLAFSAAVMVLAVAIAFRAPPATTVVLADPPPLPAPAPAPAPITTPVPETSKAVEEPVTAPTPPPQKQYGTLNVNGTPWGRVWIDGRDTGLDTPAQGIRLEAGWHTITLVHPPSGASAKTRVNIKPKSSRSVLLNIPVK